MEVLEKRIRALEEAIASEQNQELLTLKKEYLADANKQFSSLIQAKAELDMKMAQQKAEFDMKMAEKKVDSEVKIAEAEMEMKKRKLDAELAMATGN
jgi:hypothetical protein